MEYCNIKGISSGLKSRKFSAEELVKMKYDLIKKNESNLNVFITQDYDNALAKAKDLDSKNTFKNQCNILTGIPFGIKDNIFTKNLKTTGGSNLYKNFIPSENAKVVEDIYKLDAISLGKTNLDELGVGDKTISHVLQTHNPYNLDFDANGSSGGSAVFVSSGFGAFALGSDTGGSVREPAGCCGIVGFKPSYDMISLDGVFNYAKTLDHVGVFTNNITDAIITMCAVTDNFHKSIDYGFENFDYFENKTNKEVGIIKIGYFREIFESATSEEYSKIIDFLEVLKSDNKFELVELSLPELYSSREIYSVKTAIEGYYEFTSATNDYSLYGKRVNFKINQGKELIEEKETIKKVEELEKVLISKYNKFFDVVDMILTPLSSFHKDINIVTVQNFTKTPAVALPLALGSNSVPVGLQLCGKINKDYELLIRAKYIEDLIGFEHRPKNIIL